MSKDDPTWAGAFSQMSGDAKAHLFWTVMFTLIGCTTVSWYGAYQVANVHHGQGERECRKDLEISMQRRREAHNWAVMEQKKTQQAYDKLDKCKEYCNPK